MNPDVLRQRIRQRLQDLSIAQAEVGRRTGWPPNFLSDLLHGRKQSVRPENLRKLADALETTTAYLRGATDDPSPAAPVSAARPDVTGVYQPYRIPEATGLREIALPFHSKSVLSKEVLTAWRDAYDNAIGLVPFFIDRDEGRPGAVTLKEELPHATPTVPAVAGLHGGYAVMMPDQSMLPAFPMGWALFAAPRVVTPGSNVIVRLSGVSSRGILLIRHLVEAGPDHVSVMSLADGKVSTLETGDDFYSVHPILGAMADPEIL